jgi:hypothetical protein
MNVYKKLRSFIVISAVLGSSAMSVSAAEILDAWRMNLPDGSVTNIGHLVVSGGQTTATQELNAMGEVFVGARFQNFGGLFSITYTPENCPGGCDFGAPSVLPNTLDYSFSGLAGTVTSVGPGGAISFVFDPGVGLAELRVTGDPAVLATFTPTNPSGGSLANFFGAVNTSGTSNLLFDLVSMNSANLFQEADGTNFVPGKHQFALDTTNQIFSTAQLLESCPWDDAALCSQLLLTQQGKIDALKVPEPGTLALLGMGILGLSYMRRRQAI